MLRQKSKPMAKKTQKTDDAKIEMLRGNTSSGQVQMQACKHQTLRPWKFGDKTYCAAVPCKSKLSVACIACKEVWCGVHDPTPKPPPLQIELSSRTLTYKDIDQVWEKGFKAQSKEGKGGDRYYADGSIRPHVHWTKAAYIGTDSFNFVGSTPKKISQRWKAERVAYQSKNAVAEVDKFVAQIVALK